MFPRAHRLTRKGELAAVLREGKRVRTKSLDVRAVSSPLTHPRAAIVVPKRGRRIVERNRLKRRVRELVRVDVLSNLAGVDLVILTREAAYSAPFGQLRAELVRAIEELKATLRQS